MIALMLLLIAGKGDAPKVVKKPAKIAASLPAFDRGDECGACHKATGWTAVSFRHEATGFPLRFEHTKVGCDACHTLGVDAPLEPACSSCHKDPHTGTLGMHCESCHDEQSFRAAFTADAHRRSNFPLIGKHALIPCEQCHGPARERIFTRAALACVDCHQQDYEATAVRSVDHAAAGFSLECRQCHGTWRFTPALFAAHDLCFQLAGNVHTGIVCRDCHTSLSGADVSGACATQTAACSACHTHDCARTDAQHASVAGYQCKDRKCYECHRFSR